jgi:hypothetical protein
VGNRLRGKEWAEREQRYHDAKTVADVMDPYTASAAFPLDQTAKMVADALGRRKGPTLCSSQHTPGPAAAVTDELSRQGWRSVSMLCVPYGTVLSAGANAPEFLKSKAALILNAWPGPDGWFEP